MTSTPRSDWLILFALAVAVSFTVKLVIVLHSAGTLDVTYCFDYLHQLRQCGACLYNGQFNLPPFMIHGLRGLGALADWTGWPLEFWVRFPNILADVGAASLMWLMASRCTPGLFLMVLAPASIMISGYHGNTDPFMMFLVLLAIYSTRFRPVWIAGIALGMAINIKVAPVILIPVFVFYYKSLWKGVIFLAAVITTFVVASLPYLVEHPVFILERVFGYASGSGVWGVTLLLRLVEETLRHQLEPISYARILELPDPLWSLSLSSWPDARTELFLVTITIYHVLAYYGRFLLTSGICLLSIHMNRTAHQAPLFVQCSSVMCLFLFLTPGFGIQYLAWLVPLAVAAGTVPALLFYVTSGVYLYWMYTTNLGGGITSVELSLICWASTGILLLALVRQLGSTTARVGWKATCSPASLTTPHRIPNATPR